MRKIHYKSQNKQLIFSVNPLNQIALSLIFLVIYIIGSIFIHSRISKIGKDIVFEYLIISIVFIVIILNISA